MGIETAHGYCLKAGDKKFSRIKVKNSDTRQPKGYAMPAKGTQNYVWFTEKQICSGHMGHVFMARHKRQGDPCVVKVFYDIAGSSNVPAKTEEFKILQGFDHKNLVRLFAMELESHTKATVLVMEWCTEGSIVDLLSKPIFMYGLKEDDILTMIRDMCSGLEFLQSKNVKIRDIRPSNLLCSRLEENDTLVFKLVDIVHTEQAGSSKVSFGDFTVSDVYGSTFLYAVNSDSAIVWSIGALLYHVITGKSPFQLADGNLTKSTMSNFVNNKPRNSFSGFLDSVGGTIQWSNELPAHCVISGGLRALVMHVIENTFVRQRQLSFEETIKKLNHITQLKVHHVHIVPMLERYRLYSPATATLNEIKDEIAAQSGLSADQQILILGNRLLTDISRDSSSVNLNGLTTRQQPLLVLIEGSVPPSKALTMELPDLPTMVDIAETSQETTVVDTQWSHIVCGILFLVGDCVFKLASGQTFLTVCVNVLCQNLLDWNARIHDKFQDAERFSHAVLAGYDLVKRTSVEQRRAGLSSDSGIVVKPHPSYDSGRGSSVVESFHEKLESRAQSIRRRIGHIKSKKTKLNIHDLRKEYVSVDSCQLKQCEVKLSGYIDQAVKIYETFKKDEMAKLSYNDIQVHKYDKFTAAGIYTQCASLAAVYLRTSHVQSNSSCSRSVYGELTKSDDLTHEHLLVLDSTDLADECLKVKLEEIIRKSMAMLEGHCIKRTCHAVSTFRVWYSDKYCEQSRIIQRIEKEVINLREATIEFQQQYDTKRVEKHATVVYDDVNDDVQSMNVDGRLMTEIVSILQGNSSLVNKLKEDLIQIDESLRCLRVAVT